MSFSVSLENGRGCEWGNRNGLSSLFAQKKNILNPNFWQMITEIMKFKKDVLKYIEELERNPDVDRNETLGGFLKSHGYSELFQKAYLVSFSMFLRVSWTTRKFNLCCLDRYRYVVRYGQAHQTVSLTFRLTLFFRFAATIICFRFIYIYIYRLECFPSLQPKRRVFTYYLRFLFISQLFGRPQWLTVAGRSQNYVEKVPN